jgi:hypothetical protein
VKTKPRSEPVGSRDCFLDRVVWIDRGSHHRLAALTVVVGGAVRGERQVEMKKPAMEMQVGKAATKARHKGHH